ncbi:hypothetical protein O3M35_001272 [Rhynocoris fuscipes]|uniref:Uncharacterized protein n=1 Tax=Rhynocoris fuscipes TaxID=488301 RepID=A0AAW1DT75_9HEMI
MDKLLTCLLKLISQKLVFDPKPVWQLLNAFHCSSPDSYMGITITRLTVLCLCSLLALKPKVIYYLFHLTTVSKKKK